MGKNKSKINTVRANSKMWSISSGLIFLFQVFLFQFSLAFEQKQTQSQNLKQQVSFISIHNHNNLRVWIFVKLRENFCLNIFHWNIWKQKFGIWKYEWERWAEGGAGMLSRATIDIRSLAMANKNNCIQWLSVTVLFSNKNKLFE